MRYATLPTSGKKTTRDPEALVSEILIFVDIASRGIRRLGPIFARPEAIRPV